MISFWRWVAVVELATLDAVAVAVLLGRSPLGPTVALAAHAGLCLAATGAIFSGTSGWADGGRPLRGLALGIAFCIPVLGGVGFLAALTAAFGARPPESTTWTTIPIDDERLRRARPRTTRLALDRVAGILRTQTPETNARRFRAVTQVPRFSPYESVGLLRSCLKDPLDEVRLYAFAKLERLRDDVESNTRSLSELLKDEASDERRSTLHLRIAENQWEGCYLGLVEGAVLDDTIEAVLRHALDAVRLSPKNAAAWFLLGRVQLQARRYHEASEHFRLALEAGFPRIRVLPYLAEARFAQRNYIVVTALMHDLSRLSSGQRLPGGVMEFWR